MTYLVLGLLFVAVVSAMRLTFWALHVTTNRDDQ